MTVLGAVVFGGLLALGVLWLLVTAPDSEVDHAWSESHWTDGIASESRALAHSSRQ